MDPAVQRKYDAKHERNDQRIYDTQHDGHKGISGAVVFFTQHEGQTNIENNDTEQNIHLICISNGQKALKKL